MKRIAAACLLIGLLGVLTACGFKPQGNMPLAKPLHSLYIQSSRPHGDLTRYIQAYLRTSDVNLINDRNNAQTVLVISQDSDSQELIGVSSTQQTRQYNLHVTATFSVTKANGEIIIQPQTLVETRAITIQSDQVLGSSNEANQYFLQMRRELAYGIMNRLASNSLTREINAAFKPRRKKVNP